MKTTLRTSKLKSTTPVIQNVSVLIKIKQLAKLLERTPIAAILSRHMVQKNLLF